MDFEFLLPVNHKVISHNNFLHKQTLGKTLKIHTKNGGIPDMKDVKIALFCVNETRYPSAKIYYKTDTSALRIQLYKLYTGNWNIGIADLGDIEEGATIEDSDYAIKELLTYLISIDITPVVLGLSQEITYTMYRAFDTFPKMVNIATVDHCFDFDFSKDLVSLQSYMGKIITEQPSNLFNFCNLGYQSYYNAQETIDLIDTLFFDAYRLGDVIHDITIVEPVLRDADIVSIDMDSVKSGEIGQINNIQPNGFDSREICAISRYAGISDRVSAFGIYEFEKREKCFHLIAQMIWYFIEGYNFRKNEYPFDHNSKHTKYIVPIDNETLKFYQSGASERWWIELPLLKESNNKLQREALLPCTHQDYLDACNQIIPQRWWKAHKKTMN